MNIPTSRETFEYRNEEIETNTLEMARWQNYIESRIVTSESSKLMTNG